MILIERDHIFYFFETQIKDRITYNSTRDLQIGLRLSPKFQGINIESYLKDIMLGKIILSCDDFWECFTLSSKIVASYQKNGVGGLLEIYAKYDDDDSIICNRYFINHSLSHDEKLTIAYCLYQNNIYTLIDEYSGSFIAYKDLVCVPKELDENLQEIKK